MRLPFVVCCIMSAFALGLAVAGVAVSIFSLSCG